MLQNESCNSTAVILGIEKKDLHFWHNFKCLKGDRKMSNTKITLKHCSSWTGRNYRYFVYGKILNPLHLWKGWLVETQNQWLSGFAKITPMLWKSWASTCWGTYEEIGALLWSCSSLWSLSKHFCCINPKSSPQSFQNDILIW